jgi:poly(glycerol-phosphate) alpha-glucosyltransferase
VEVVFRGPVYGAEKKALLSLADAFILPSMSEGLPMAILEAWSYRIPVLMTDECNLPEGFARGAAFRIGKDPRDIVPGLEFLFSSGASTLHQMGNKGRELVSEKFSWPRIAHSMRGVYEWILGGGTAPDCVQIQKG